MALNHAQHVRGYTCVKRLRELLLRRGFPTDDIDDDDLEVLARANEWLSKNEPAFEAYLAASDHDDDDE
jgi:hypothetical protein